MIASESGHTLQILLLTKGIAIVSFVFTFQSHHRTSLVNDTILAWIGYNDSVNDDDISSRVNMIKCNRIVVWWLFFGVVGSAFSGGIGVAVNWSDTVVHWRWAVWKFQHYGVQSS